MEPETNQLRAVLFDAVGTLLFADAPVLDVYAAIGRQCGSSADADELAARYRAAFRQQEEIDRRADGLRTDEARERARWQSIVGSVFCDARDPQAAFTSLWEHFARPSSWRLAADAEHVFAELARRNLIWGLASNFDGRLHAICQGLPQLSGLQHVFVSSQLGWRKPSPRFFRSIEQRLHLPPQSLLMVGDDVENDFLAARACGWRAVLVGREQHATAVPCVKSLRELIPIVDALIDAGARS